MSTHRTPSVKAFLQKAIKNSPQTQGEIAKAAGLTHPNALSMMKTGDTKVPIDLIPALAKALNVETKHFLLIAIREYHPEIWAIIHELLKPDLTQFEEKILDAYHFALTDDDIPWSDALERALISLFELATKSSATP